MRNDSAQLCGALVCLTAVINTDGIHIRDQEVRGHFWM